MGLIHAVASLRFRRFRPELGASLVEYAFLIALIAIVCILAIQFLGARTSTSLSHSTSAIG